jgi:hypothetical protein
MLAGDRTGAVEQARRLIDHAEAGVNAGPDREQRRANVAAAYLTLASVHRTFEEWEAAREAASRAVAEVRPPAQRQQL